MHDLFSFLGWMRVRYCFIYVWEGCSIIMYSIEHAKFAKKRGNFTCSYMKVS